MDSAGSSSTATADWVVGRFHRWILALMVIGWLGTGIELLLLGHYDNPWQLTPLVLIAVALGVAGWLTARPTAAGLRAWRIVMWAFIVAGALGVMLHFRGGLEFQAETDPTLGRAQLFWKVLRAQSPPALAPGVMAQMGLLGLIYTYRHPAGRRAVDEHAETSGGGIR